MNSVVSLRTAAALRQQLNCFYCGCRMWLKNPAELQAVARLSQRQVALLQCTAEHLIPRSEGGPDRADNIVAACRYCNQHRHRRKRALAPLPFRRMVAQRVQAGRWHTLAHNIAGAPNNSSKPTR